MTASAVVPREHDAFVAYRASLKGLGASDAPSVLGLNRRQSAFDLWARLTGRIAPDPGNRRTRRGLRLEPVAAAWYAEETGRRLQEIHRTVRDARFPHVFAHPDRRVVGERRLVQIKTRWSDYPDGEVPVAVQTQVSVEAALARVPIVDVALMTFEELFIHPVAVDPATGEELVEYLNRWYIRHVEGDVAPRDGSPGYSRHLNEYVREAAERATAEQDRLMAQLRRLRAQQAALEAGESAVIIALKESMAGATLLEGDDWRIAWRPTKGATRIAWQQVAATYRQLLVNLAATDAVLDEVEGLYTSSSEPGRQFRPTWTGPEEGTDDD